MSVYQYYLDGGELKGVSAIAPTDCFYLSDIRSFGRIVIK